MAKSTGKGRNSVGSNVPQGGALLEAENLAGSYICTTDQNEFTLKVLDSERFMLTYTKSETKTGNKPVSVAMVKQMISIGSFKKI